MYFCKFKYKHIAMRTRILSLLACCALMCAGACAQTNISTDIDRLSWGKVANGMPASWYAGEQAEAIADQLLARQMDCGGWQKNIPYHRLLSPDELSRVRRTGPGATIDNGATTTEMRFLARVYGATGEARYKEGFLKGLGYLFEAQYANGGWPQFYPPRAEGHYSSHITYNDNAMVNVLYVLRDVAENRAPYDALGLDDATRERARSAFDRGIACILKTQIRVNGEPTVWCAQHDEHTFAPAPARAYELVSFSGSESAGIVRLLMSLPHPSPEVVAAVKGAVKWFEAHEVKDIRVEKLHAGTPQRDARVVAAPGNVLWARFYDLKTERPFFCDRDGIKRDTLSEVGQERRGGYAWYTDAPRHVIDAYPGWLESIGK